MMHNIFQFCPLDRCGSILLFQLKIIIMPVSSKQAVVSPLRLIEDKRPEERYYPREVIMKVSFNYGISTYSGTEDRMVYQSWFHNRLCMGRKFVYPTLNENHHHLGAIGKNLRSVYKTANAAYTDDFKEYALRNKQQNTSRYLEFLHPMPGPMALFVEMMFAWQKTDPTHIDLTAITVADIVTRDADVRTVKRAVDASYLLVVNPYNDLTSDIQ